MITEYNESIFESTQRIFLKSLLKRQQELIENYDNLSEDQKRLAVRNEIKEHNKALADTAHKAGVVTPIDYATFPKKVIKVCMEVLMQKI